ncbi:tripartite tricarboxylate transporter substrate binding protein [Mesorhizobium sp. SB112]|uniref:Bug family tripartite tricarboxylate transporter substrate binding protein n=1 Tax=Mesorhizobium sp. SB112 TaxID=3151853 RepID=UPI0032669577
MGIFSSGFSRICAVAPIAVLLAASPVAAQPYPEREVTLIVQGSAGGGSDIIARTIANIIQQENLLPNRILVENRPGGGGAVGYNFVAQRKGDPYFVGTIGSSFFTTPLLGQSPVSYKDFTPIAAIAEDPYVMTVKAESPFKSLDDIKEAASIRIGTTGVVTDPGLIGAQLRDALGIEVRAVPFGGDGEVLAALLGGHIDVQFGNPSEVLSQVQAGSLRAIAVSSAERLPTLPDVPTFTELGQDIVVTQLRGMVMPLDVPKEAVAFWEEIMKKVAESDGWKKDYIERNGSLPLFLDSAAFAARMPEQSAMYEAYMKTVQAIK